ncbi:MAG: flagellin [Alphaproteobacteria bacterium]|jgi:flagellin|nr:flagellin [Alphaproteobacteria bacterium]
MAMSVNTNPGAMIALQSLTKTTNMLQTTQFRITTGLRVNGPKDDAATFAIAQNMRGDIAGMSAVKTNLSLGQSVTSVAIDAGTAIANLLTEMKAKSVQGSQSGLDSDSYTALNQEFTSLRAQLTTIVETAEFNGTNLITSVATNLSILSTVDGSTITVTAQKLDTTTLVLHTASLTTAANASQARVLIDTAITTVSNALAALGSAAKRVDIQTEFTGKLQDILKQGVGNLVDADLAQESANLQALQIKQQLGVQALAIANAGPQSILALFQ